LSFPNTIKSEYTDKYEIKTHLEKGSHTLTLFHKKGTFVVDSMLVEPFAERKSISVIPDADRTQNGMVSFLAVAPYDGYFKITASADAAFAVDGAYGATSGKAATVYLRRGLNYIDFEAPNGIECSIAPTEEKGFSVTVNADEMRLDGSAFINESGCVDGISAESGKASFAVNAPKSGSYRLTLTYSNNDEGGVHAYNVDLIERFVTLSINGEAQNIWCRNTYSWDTFKTVTADVELQKGENIITLSNDGSTVFNGRTPEAPIIAQITVNEAVKGE
ncbi:MAG: hypothetical protein J6A60_02240, partial [Clostridia bacterium]|nr:hypothetical protein [Clostridia bacterium]